MAKLQLNESWLSGFDGIAIISIFPSGVPSGFLNVYLIECSKLLSRISNMPSIFWYCSENVRNLNACSVCFSAAATI